MQRFQLAFLAYLSSNFKIKRKRFVSVALIYLRASGFFFHAAGVLCSFCHKCFEQLITFRHFTYLAPSYYGSPMGHNPFKIILTTRTQRFSYNENIRQLFTSKQVFLTGVVQNLGSLFSQFMIIRISSNKITSLGLLYL